MGTCWISETLAGIDILIFFLNATNGWTWRWLTPHSLVVSAHMLLVFYQIWFLLLGTVVLLGLEVKSLDLGKVEINTYVIFILLISM